MGGLKTILLRQARIVKAAIQSYGALLVFVISIGITALGWHLGNQLTLREARKIFDSEADRARLDLIARLNIYEQVLQGAAGLLHAVPDIGRGDWRTYVANLDIERRYPGMQGLGFSATISAAEREANVRQIRAEGFPDYRIWPEGEREIYTPVIYLEPLDWRNKRAFGFDMFSEPIRRRAMERARDTGLPAISGKVTLVQDAELASRLGFLMYVPVYREPQPTTTEERRAQLLGYVFSPIRMAEFMRGLLGSTTNDIQLQILDAESNGDVLLYDGASAQPAKEPSAALPFAASYEIEVYQHRWTLRATPMPSLAVDSKEPLAVLVAGILISALLGLITWTITAGHARSVAANERLRFDIAKRRQLEQELRAKEESFRFLFQKSPNAMWVVDRESLRFLQVNEQAMTTYGYSEQEFLRMRITDIRPPDDIPQVTSLYQEDEAGFRTTGPWRHVLKSGKVIDVEVSGTSISFAGRPSRLTIVRDISERVASDLALRQSEERFRNLVEGSIQGILVHDAAGRPLFINRAFTRIYGFETPEEVLQLDSLDHLIPTDELERILAYRRARLRGEPAPSRYECKRLRRDGTMMWLENRSRLIEWNGKPAIQAVIIDITERKRAEEELLQAQKLEAVGHLTGGVAHDFNNLLTVILGNAEILADQLRGDERLRKLAEMTRVAAENGAELTRQLLAFARKQTLEPRVVDVGKLVGAIHAVLRRTLSEDIDIEVIQRGGLWSALVDPAQLEAAVLNLALNARDAMPKGGRLTIETANAPLDPAYAERHAEVEPGDYVMVAVADTGIGMAPEVAARAFEPFFTTKEVGKGSGLGLSMVYGFARQSHGHLQIYSEPGHGTIVKIYIPRAEALGAMERPDRGSAVELGGHETVLLVEDNELVRGHVDQLLNSLGYAVISVRDGRQALEILRSAAKVDLLFTDVIMPGGMNGLQLAEAARELRAQLPVLFTSGYTESAFLNQSQIDTGVHLLSKPYRRRDLAAKLRELLAVSVH